MTPAQYRKERTQRGLTQAALAALLGVPREAVVRREAGTQPIIAEAARALLSLPKTKPAKPGKPNTEMCNEPKNGGATS
jgi:transcriptional regulator with XRE-family HTH domain